MRKRSYFPYTVISNSHEAKETVRITLRPHSKKNHTFIPGQYCYLQIPGSDLAKPFSIASAPEEQFLEFCIKTYGSFSLALSKTKPGDRILVSEPTGSFVWEKSIKNATFLIGGIGISPIISMLSHIEKTNQRPTLTLFYGNRTPETKAYAKELIALQKTIPLRVIDMYSHLDAVHPWPGYRGFLTKEILQKEIVSTPHALFFLVGPPIFLEKMIVALEELDILPANIKTEVIS